MSEMNDLIEYRQFISSKAITTEMSGIDVDKESLNPKLYDFQKDIVRWALAKGKAAIFADCGLGKTPMQLEWAKNICEHTGGKVLILAPLAVSSQTVHEGEKFGIPVRICESQDDVTDGISITNYEKLEKFVANEFEGIVLDESSILKSFTGKIRNQIIENFRKTPYKLACTATPAPNDYMELGNHSEFLGVMTRSEMLSMFFVHDGGQTSKWRLKGHADHLFWEWLCTWAVYVNSPDDIGYHEEGFDLPELRMHEVIVDGNEPVSEVLTLTERRNARRDTLDLRCEKAAELANGTEDQWLVWCDLNYESAALSEKIQDSVEVKGADSNQHKSDSMLGFSNGDVKCLVTKPSIAGFGMNWQNCHNMIFVGLSDSYEQFYQAVRRCWRFGQQQPVDVYIVIAAREGAVRENIDRKQKDFLHMKSVMSDYTKEITAKELKKTTRISTPYNAGMQIVLPNWREFAS